MTLTPDDYRTAIIIALLLIIPFLVWCIRGDDIRRAGVEPEEWHDTQAESDGK